MDSQPFIKRAPLSQNEIPNVLESTIHSSPSIEAAVLQMMDRYTFDMVVLQDIINRSGLHVCFSRITFRSVAPIVGLNPDAMLRDAWSFILHRARIPNELFGKVMDDVDVAINNYGPPGEQESLKASSMFVSAIYMRLVAQFKLLFTNSPEEVKHSPLTEDYRIENVFRIFGSIALLFIQVRCSLSAGDGYYDVLARAIAELYCCDFINHRNDLETQIYCILCDGISFHFFVFSRDSIARLSTATFPFSKAHLNTRQALKLADLRSESPADFWCSIRVVCEAIFYVLLLAYGDSIEAYIGRLERQNEDQKAPKELRDCAEFAAEALSGASVAARKHADGMIDEGQDMAKEALENLKMSLEKAPRAFKRDDVQLMEDIDMGMIRFI